MPISPTYLHKKGHFFTFYKSAILDPPMLFATSEAV